MATIQRPLKTYGNRTYVAEVAAAPSNQDPILANEVDGDIDTMYSAWNGGADTVNIKDGAVTYAKLAPDARLWKRIGTVLSPGTAGDTASILSAANADFLTWGSSGTKPKARLISYPGTGTSGECWMTFNTTQAGVQDDATKPSWWTGMYADAFDVNRAPAGSATATNLLRLDGTGRLTLAANEINYRIGTTVRKGRLTTWGNSWGTATLTANLLIPGYALDYTAKWGIELDLDSYSGALGLSLVKPGTTTPVVAGGNATMWLTATSVQYDTPDSAATFSEWVTQMRHFGSGVGATLRCCSGRGTLNTPAATQQGDIFAQIEARGFGTSTPQGIGLVGGLIRLTASELWTNTANGTMFEVYTTTNGTQNIGGAGGYLRLDGAGNLIISGATGTKASGTTWANPSDIRLKQDIGAYSRGLGDILKLEPITYRLKADPDRECQGFDAAAVQEVFPECVGTTKMKLDPDGEEEEVLTFDMHPVLVALVNAVKELSAKIGVAA